MINVPGELWLLYSVKIQLTERATLEMRTSSMSPFQQKTPATEPMVATGLDEAVGDAAVGPASSDPSLYNLKFDPSNVPTM